MKKAFKKSVEDYLDFCKKRNEKLDKLFSDKFNLRLGPELHREAYVAAKESGKSLNQWIKEVIKHNLHR